MSVKIDRDKLTKYFSESKCANLVCDECDYVKFDFCHQLMIADILKSHHELIEVVQCNIPVPVKKTYTLKPEYKTFAITAGLAIVDIETKSEVSGLLAEFYDLKTEPDYSKIEVGTIVEIVFHNGQSNSGYVNKVDKSTITVGFHTQSYMAGNHTTIYYSNIKSLTILKLPEVKE
jgi:hypothetical protein